MPRFEVIESKVWQRDDGRTASIYGAVPWVSPVEEKRWKMITRGYTVRDNERGTAGIGRQPWATRAEAQAWVDKETARLEEARRRHEENYPKKSPAQLQREIDEALSRKPSRTSRKRVHATRTASPVEVGDFVSFKSKYDDSTVRGRVVEVAWLDDHWSAMVKMAGRPGNAIVRADELTKLAKAGSRAHATKKTSPTQLFVEGVGHRLPHGYEIHWNWTARRGGKKIDGGALTGGEITEFYEEWPDYRGQADVVEQMKKTLREWISSGEFGPIDLSKVNVSLRKSGSDVPIRGR